MFAENRLGRTTKLRRSDIGIICRSYGAFILQLPPSTNIPLLSELP